MAVRAQNPEIFETMIVTDSVDVIDLQSQGQPVPLRKLPAQGTFMLPAEVSDKPAKKMALVENVPARLNKDVVVASSLRTGVRLGKVQRDSVVMACCLKHRDSAGAVVHSQINDGLTNRFAFHHSFANCFFVLEDGVASSHKFTLHRNNYTCALDTGK